MTVADSGRAPRSPFAAPGAWRICHAQAEALGDPLARDGGWEALCRRAHEAGFDTLLSSALWRQPEGRRSGVAQDADACDPVLHPGGATMTQVLRALSDTAARQGLDLALDLALDRVAADVVPATADPAWLESDHDDPTRDPRRPETDWGVRYLRHGLPGPAFAQRWIERLAEWIRCGVQAFRCMAPQRLGGAGWAALIGPLREEFPHVRFLAWTPGLDPGQLADLRQAGFDAVFSSVPWWDFRAPWLAEEDVRLRAVASVIAMPEVPQAAAPPGRYARALWTAVVTGDGVLAQPRDDAQWEMTAQALQWRAATPLRGAPRLCVGDRGYCTALLRESGPVSDGAAGAHLLLLNPEDSEPARADWAGSAGLAPPGRLVRLNGADEGDELPPAGYRLCGVDTSDPEWKPLARPASARPDPRLAPRIVVEQVTPVLDGGRHMPKCVAGETVAVQADIYLDGHDELAATVQWRAADETAWHSVPMRHLGNDRWQAELRPRRVGQHEFRIAAWLDEWQTYRTELRKKHAAGVQVGLELQEGALHLREALERAGRQRRSASARAVVERALERLAELVGAGTGAAGATAGSAPSAPGAAPARAAARPTRVSRGRGIAPRGEDNDASTSVPAAADPGPLPDLSGMPPDAAAIRAADAMVQTLLETELADAMAALADHPFLTETPEPYPLWADRRAAGFSSWYELFPRSQSPQAGRHGTFDDVHARLPDIRAMGFDVLYFPPIHPIGHAHRKGPNNSLHAGEHDPGSPYAIGSPEGGHDAIHPELGTLEDFLRLVKAAHAYGLEIALDYAIQCSPDHPWLRERPDWFSRRADGSIRYAENPPKKYEDIVNVSFYRRNARRARVLPLWRALRDVVLFWAEHGVRIFRVDNPHTKPLPFWEWLIADVHMRHPDVVFLSEAFTRPKMMYRLAKIGFTQSYTYFTWRNEKHEIAAYLEELASVPIADFFRPNFFVNTPDINPYYLQSGLRAAFLARAALAALGAGSWGLYSGFELCEWQPVPGKEEYLDSEKYQLRQRDWNAPGHIKGEIAQLNAIRQAHPALWSQRGYRTVPNDNPHVLSFLRTSTDGGSTLLAAINLDPHGPQHAALEVPYDAAVRQGRAAVRAEDLLDGGAALWPEGRTHVSLHPGRPYRVWRLTAPE